MYELFITALEIASATSSLPYPILLTIAPPAASRIFLPSLVYKYAPLELSNSVHHVCLRKGHFICSINPP